MLALIQRVALARVRVQGEIVGEIGAGLLVLLCALRDDSEIEADRMLARVLKLRIFADGQGRMNRGVQDIAQGGLLVVSQFTLAADPSGGGNRPGFSHAAAPADALRLYEYFLSRARARHPVVQAGRFGADMQVELVNDGPVTILLRVDPRRTESRS